MDTKTQSTTDRAMTFAEQIAAALEAAGHKAVVWAADCGKQVRVYVGQRGTNQGYVRLGVTSTGVEYMTCGRSSSWSSVADRAWDAC